MNERQMTPAEIEAQQAEEARLDKIAAEKAEKAAAAAAAKAAKAAVEAPKRYAAYNLSQGRFFGGVRDTKADAAELVKAAKGQGYDAEVREV